MIKDTMPPQVQESVRVLVEDVFDHANVAGVDEMALVLAIVECVHASKLRDATEDGEG